MKTALAISILAFAVFGAGIGIGRYHAIWTKGYYYEVHQQETYRAKSQTIEWRYVTKKVGLPFMDPGATEIEFNGRLLYSADCAFQESAPYARDIKFDGQNLEWDDGDFSYFLTIKESKYKKEPNKAMQPTPVDVTDRADARSAPSTSVADL